MTGFSQRQVAQFGDDEIIDHDALLGRATLRVALCVPLTVDGILYSSSMVLLWCARYRLRVPVVAWFAMGWASPQPLP